MAQLLKYATADLANTSPNNLEFAQDEKSQRALKASKNSVDPNSDRITIETLFQIVSLENISQSKVSKLDELLAADDLDAVGADRLRGRQQRIIRNVNVEEDSNTNSGNVEASPATNASNYFKITLQDCFGNLVFGIEQEKLQFLTGKNYKSGFPIQLGSKVLINNADIVHGVLLLKPSNTEFLSGVVQVWNLDLTKKHIHHLKNQLEKIKAQNDENT